MSSNQLNRVAVMVALVEVVRSSGRTALMKYCFFLQVVRRVPLGYSFTLYSYGPFDSDVMADLQTAEALNVLRSQTVLYPGGYGYSITSGQNAGQINKRYDTFLSPYREDINWVAGTFGHYNASDLELLSTILFVSIREKALSNENIAARVFIVKPHFTMIQIRSKVAWLESQALLRNGQL